MRPFGRRSSSRALCSGSPSWQELGNVRDLLQMRASWLFFWCGRCAWDGDLRKIVADVACCSMMQPPPPPPIWCSRCSVILEIGQWIPSGPFMFRVLCALVETTVHLNHLSESCVTYVSVKLNVVWTAAGSVGLPFAWSCNRNPHATLLVVIVVLPQFLSALVPNIK